MRRIFLYIIALAFIGLAIAGKASGPEINKILPKASVADSTATLNVVPLDSLTLDTKSAVTVNDTTFFRTDSILATTDSIFLTPDSLADDSLHRAKMAEALPPIPQEEHFHESIVKKRILKTKLLSTPKTLW